MTTTTPAPTPTPTGRGRGRGRGLGKNWLGNFKPNPCLVKKQDVLALGGQFENTDKDFKDSTQSIDELSERLADDVLSDEKKEVDGILSSILDEKPSARNHGSGTVHLDEKLPNIDIVSDANSKTIEPTTSDQNISYSSSSSVLANSINAKEFVPTFQIQNEEKPQQTDFSVEDENTIVLNVLTDVMMMLIDDPALLHENLFQLSEHLHNFVTKEDTLKAVVVVLFQQGLTERSHAYIIAKICQHLDDSKCLELENGITFRKLFFQTCQEEFKKIKLELNSKLVDRDKITNTSLLFGELYCNMKLKGKANPLFKHTVFKLVEMLLNCDDPELLTTLTKLLKLVGPELDVDRPKDVQDMFDKVKDFYLDKKKTEHLPSSVKDALWRVYKLHSRDWDRKSSQPSTPTYSYSPKLPEHQQDSAMEFPVPVDWNEYYSGDDSDLYKSYFESTDETEDHYDDAYEEFLKISGQV